MPFIAARVYSRLRGVFNESSQQDIMFDGLTPAETTTAINVVATGEVETLNQKEIAHPQLPLDTERVPYAERFVRQIYSLGNGSFLSEWPRARLALNFLLDRQFENYHYYHYDAIIVRITYNAPRSIAGFMAVSWAPFGSVDTTAPLTDYTAGQDQWFSTFGLREECTMMSLSEPQDLEIRIPWTFPSRWLRTYQIATSNKTFDPVLSFFTLYNQLSTATYTPELTLFMKYENLQLALPQGVLDDVTLEYQMDTFVNTVAGAAGKVATGAAVAGASVLAAKVGSIIDDRTQRFCDYTGWCDATSEPFSEPPQARVEENSRAKCDPNPESQNNFGHPTFVRPTLFGDTYGIDSVPGVNTRAVWQSQKPPNSVEGRGEHSLLSFLSRPQILNHRSIGVSPTSWAVHYAPNAQIATRFPNWFAFFGNIARLWRGSLRAGIIVWGHPMVTVRVRATFSRETPTATDNTTYYNAVYNITGTSTVTCLVPYLHPAEYLAYDTLNSADELGLITFTVNVVSSTMDATPSIYVTTFMQAGPDFAYYDPRPPGYYNPFPQEIEPEQQVLVAGAQHKNFVIGGAFTQEPGHFIRLDTIEQLCRMFAQVYPLGVDASASDNDQNQLFNNPTLGFSADDWCQPGTSFDVSTDQAWFGQCDYVSYLSSLFSFWRGSMKYKVVCSGTGWRYLAQNDYASTRLNYTPVAPNTAIFPENTGGGLAITRVEEQPVFEFSLSMRGPLLYGFTCVGAQNSLLGATFTTIEYVPDWRTNIEPIEWVGEDNEQPKIKDLVFRAANPNFFLFQEQMCPPFALWLGRGFN